MNLPASEETPLSIDDCRALVADGMTAVDTLIRKRLASDVVLINQLSSYIIGSGGKRLRPQLVLLATAAAGIEQSAQHGDGDGPDHKPIQNRNWGENESSGEYESQKQGGESVNLSDHNEQSARHQQSSGDRAGSSADWSANSSASNHAITVAAIIEFIHTATLLHDDVVDASEMRRGRDTANSVWGNEAAVLVGDFLYSRAFEMMVDVQSLDVMAILATTTNRIAEGEVMQLMNVREPSVTEQQYIEVIQAKTARLFQAATELGGVLTSAAESHRKALADYGMHLGTAFQIADDVLDYQSDSGTIGKNIGDDLAEGKTTLPLIYAMRDGTPEQAQLIASAITTDGLDALTGVMAAIEHTDALNLSMQTATDAADAAIAALAPLPGSNYKDALERIARYSVERSH